MKHVMHIQPFALALLVLGIIVLGTIVPAPARAQQATLRAHVVSGGAGSATSTTHQLHGTAGTPAVAIVAGQDHVLYSGFWHQVRPPAAVLLPVAARDTVATDEDVAVTIRPLDNDIDPSGGSLTITSVTQPDSGTVELQGDTSLTYVPRPDFHGQDTFTYTANNTQGGSATATVTATRSISKLEKVLAGIAAAVTYGASATLVTGGIVLIGAAAAGERARTYEAAVLKTLGAPRRAILANFALRSAILGAAAGLVAIFAGAAAGWAVTTFVMETEYRFEPASALAIVTGGVLATLLAGLAFAWRPLAARPAQVLRARE